MKNKHLTTGIITFVTIIGSLGMPMIASAEYRPVTRQLCDLAIFPFNLSGTKHFGDDSTNYINGRPTEFPGGTITDAICKLSLGGHLAVPTGTPYITQSYDPQPVQDTSDIPLKPGSENHYVPSALHMHSYFNDSAEEGPGVQQFFYKSVIAKFAIDFAPDIAQNINLSDISCITDIPSWYKGDLSDLLDCDGYVDDLWGGTSVTKSPTGVVWSFGLGKNPDGTFRVNERPRIFGNNPDLDPFVPGGFNSSLEKNREFFAYVQLPTREDLTSKLWSATTTSRVLIRDYAIKKTDKLSRLYDSNFCPASQAGNYDEFWCSLDSQRPANFATEVPPNGSKAYYWFPIGTVSTVWRPSAPSITTPPSTLVCKNLTLTPSTVVGPDKDNFYNAQVQVEDTKNPGVALDRPATLNWTGTNGIYSFADNGPHGTSSMFSSTFHTNPGVPNASVSAALTSITPNAGETVDATSFAACQKTLAANFFTPPPGANVCTDLGLNVDGTPRTSTVIVGPNEKHRLKATPVNTPPNPTAPLHPVAVQWTQSGAGELSLGPASEGLNAGTPGTCPTPTNSFTAPVACDYLYKTPATGTGSVTVTAVANATNKDVSACTLPILFSETPPPAKECLNLNVTFPKPDLVCVSPNPPGTATAYDWLINGFLQPNHGDCQNIFPGDNWAVRAQGSLVCKASGAVPPLPPQPPTLIKTVRALNPPEAKQGEKGGSVPLTLVPSIEGKVVEYKLIFTPNGPYPTTGHIVDDISKGYIQGITNTGEDGGKIVYNDHQGVSIPPCAGVPKVECFEGDIGFPGGITLYEVTKPVFITYQGKVWGSKLSEKNCKDNQSAVCQEKYPNTAHAKFEIYDSAHNVILASIQPLEASALVQSFCQYILTRAAGDIYLETDLNFGKDINVCSKFKSSTGLIVTPGPEATPKAPSTGANQTVAIGHEICAQGQAGTLSRNLEKLYGKDAASKNLSSQICEVKLRPGQSWTKSQITSSIKENTTRVSRWEPNLNSQISTLSTFEDLNLLFGEDTHVYHKTNGDLTLGGFGQDLMLNDGQGSKTFIIEHGNLIIKDNIKYGACNKPSGVCSARDTASLAFIVLDGHVEIDKDVTEVAGVFFVQKGDKAESGKLKALGGQDSFEKLTIYGSVYGDIQDLFEHRKFAGDPASNDGSVVIRFDERIILNTPPGLQDLLQLTQKPVA